ncbi:LacI family DNA-binding transcriptional regulator [Treponema sp. HNW]|uniref:LacI family DNA-binding transcriptional regulator n=1 Tax=Treponema sp. HNW TaxID=3116654 RepID=UPI003D1505AE
MATIKEIAAKTGVSPTTVSNVLHGRTAKVSAKTLKTVQAAIENEKYTPNMGAALLAHSVSRIIGVIVFMDPRSGETVFQDPFTGTMIGALEKEIQKNGYFMMLYATNEPEAVLKLIHNWKLDGMILFWIGSDMCSVIRKNTDIPLVFIDCYFNDDGLTYHNVGLNDYQGSYEMTWYLIKSGHRSIAFLADRKILVGGDKERFKGFKQAVSDAGLGGGENFFVALSKDGEKRKEVYESLCKKDVSFTALFFSADYYAAEALSFFQKKGIEVPGRFSIAGFDNNMYAQVVNPPLTTVHQDTVHRGKEAVKMLLQLIRKESLCVPNIRLPVRLIVRDSVSTIPPY